MGSRTYTIKDNDWQSVRNAIQILNQRLSTTALPVFGGIVVEGTAVLSDATIDTAAIGSATISSLAFISADGDNATISAVAFGSATVSTMSLSSGTFTSFTAISATVSALVANSANISSVAGLSATFANLSVTTGNFTSFTAISATVSALVAASANISTVAGISATWTGINATDIVTATISSTSGTFTSQSIVSATVSALVANTANISAVAAASIVVTSLVAISATISSLVVSSINATVDIPITLQMYDAEPARGSETNWNGAFQSLITSQALDTSPTDITVSKGTGKFVTIINAGSVVTGTINVYGDSVNRDTGAITSADTDALTIDTLSTNSSTTDANSNVVHMYEDAYITSKWFTGTVVLSTPDLTLTDVDVYHVSFEQMNDKPNLTLNTFDASLFTSNVNAEFDAYLFTLHVTGDKCEIHNEGGLHVGNVGLPALASKYWRLRQGSINDAIDGTTDGLWVDVHYSNSPSYVEDVTVKVWLTQNTELTLS